MKKLIKALQWVTETADDDKLNNKKAKQQLKALKKVMEKLEAKKKNLRDKLRNANLDSKKQREIKEKIKIISAQQRKGEKYSETLSAQLKRS